METIRAMGDRALYEAIPPHIDISIRGDYGGSNDVPGKKKSLLVIAILGGLVWMAI